MIRYQENGAVPATVNTSEARLPASYEAAKQALANCEQIDECVTWADKAAALASYAKQAKDDELMKRSTRIRDRAIRRAGELLKQIEPQDKGGDRKSDHGEGDHTVISRADAARQAGMSKHQQVQAVRVANVPAEEFERQVESENPPTVTKLAEQGKQPAPTPKPVIDLKGRDPGEFNRSLHFVAEFEDYAKAISKFDLAIILPGLSPDEAARVRTAIAKIDSIHDSIITRI
jgi:hypothetical protein